MSSCLTVSVLNISGQGCDARSSYRPAAVLWEALIKSVPAGFSVKILCSRFYVIVEYFLLNL